MKNLDEFINYINKNLTGELKFDNDFFYRNILSNDKRLTIDESITIMHKCPKLFSIMLTINPENKLVSNSSLYSAFKTMTEDEEVNNDFDEDKIVNARDEAYFSDMNLEALKANRKDIDLLKLHLSEIGPIPLLSKKETVDLFKRYEKGDEEARNKILTHNLKLSVSIAKRYIGRGVAIMDLIEQGYIGLMRAIEKFDYRRGYNFSTYATWWVRQSIVRYIADHALAIRIPVHMHESINKIKIYAEAYIKANNCEPSKEEVINATGVKEKAYELYEYINSNSYVISLDKPVIGDGTEDSESCVGDFLSVDESEGFDNQVVNKLAYDKFDEILENCGLNERELKIIKLRYGFIDDKTHTLEEVGREFGITRERVRQIEVKALRKLRARKNAEKLNQFSESYGTREEENYWPYSLRR